jgi:hypothetical protein
MIRCRLRDALQMPYAVWLGIVTAIFVGSRLLFYHAGIRFDATTLNWYWQYVDPQLLRDRLLESTYYLHSQPPLFNLFIGLILKTFPGHETPAFMIIYKIMGLILALSVFTLMRQLKIRAYLALALTTAFTISPSSICYENWLFYSYPLAVLLCIAALLVHRYVTTARWIWGFLFFGALAIVVLMRSMFHPLWLVLIMFSIIYLKRHDWRRVIIAAMIPLAAIVLLYAKNAVVFGSLGGSSWLGMSLAKMTTFKIPEDERDLLVEQGRLSKMALIKPFRDIGAYQRYLPMPQRTGVPVLDEERKSAGDPRYNTNFNNLIFIEVARLYRQDAITVLKMYPGVYLKTVATSLGICFFPASDYTFLEGNRRRIAGLSAFYDRAIYGQFLIGGARRWKEGARSGWRRVNRIGFFLAAGFAAFLVCVVRRIRHSSFDQPLKATLIFVYISVLYVVMVSSLVEIGENNRFRFIIDPLFLAGFGVCLNEAVTRLTKARKV